MNEKKRDTGESTRLMQRLEVVGRQMPGWQRFLFQLFGTVMIIAPLLRFLLLDLLGVGKHDHPESGWVAVAQVILLEYGGSLAVMWVGLMLLYPPVMAFTLLAFRRVVIRNGRDKP